jgi:hypothetical protein
MAKADSDSTPSARDWRAVAKTLPTGANLLHVRTALERIKADRSTPLQLAKECEKRVRQNRRSLGLTEEGSTLAEQLKQQIKHDSEQTELFKQIVKQRQPRIFLRHYKILSLWENVGGYLPISTPRKRKTEAHWPDPEGPVIVYLQAAYKMVFGKPLSARQAKDVVRRYRQLKFGAATMAGAGVFAIDDDKVGILARRHADEDANVCARLSGSRAAKDVGRFSKNLFR